MNRSGKTLSGLIAAIGIVKILFPTALGSFFALDKTVALFAIAVAVLTYGVWAGPLRAFAGSSVTRFLGFSVLLAGVVSITSPTLLGLRGTYLPIADIFLIIESGVVLQLLGLEKKQPETFAPLSVFASLWQLTGGRSGHETADVNTAKTRVV